VRRRAIAVAGWLTLISSAPALGAAQSESNTPGSKQPTFEIVEVQEHAIAYREHVGPYWRIGRSFREITDWMLSTGQNAALFATYHDDPLRTEAQSLHADIGCFCTQPPRDNALASDTVSAHTAAVMILPEGTDPNPVHHRRLLSWLAAQGHVPDGPVTEIYPDPFGDRDPVRVRVPIITPTPKPATLAEPEAEPEIVGDGATAFPTIERTPLKQLLAESAFDRIPNRLAPLSSETPPDLRDWLIDVCDRLRVIRSIAVEKLKENHSIEDLLAPLVERGRDLRAAAAKDSGAAATPASLLNPVTSRQRNREKTDILKAFDRLIVSVHLKTLEVEEFNVALTDLLIRVEVVVHPADEASVVEHARENNE
jgi:DNA gyrase inhibitor GyrI